jgi:NADH-quinone oxidoreductase subunit L
MLDLIKFVPLLPLIGFTILGLFGSRIKNEKIIGIIGTSTVLGAFLIALNVFMGINAAHLEKPHIVTVFNWITTGDLNINYSFQVDQLSILFTLIITGIGTLIHIYSIGYMHGDKSFFRFFAYLNLFIFMMLNLVLASNYLVTFLGWEGVGLASYLLIGFWYDQKFEGYKITWTGDAANKAFIVNRIGDFGFLIAMFLVFVNFGTLEYQGVKEIVLTREAELMGSGNGLITAIALLMFLGCTGKSAQIPLAGWLPDAMAGPTSVSALIHAATMVTAGLFLIARNNVVFALSPDALNVVAIVGALTALLAATVGIVQNDIKKVLAYSTVSQLGFMFVAMGVGAFTAGLFHVMTHAFFKALLFLGAGSVIHGMHHEQNIKNMGGLKKHMPVTYWTFLMGTIAIAGIPFFSGFFSKDEILWKAFSEGNTIIWLMLATAAFCTAFYMFRMLFLTFHGKERFDHHHHHPHESPATMLTALVVLAVLSIFGGFLGVPHALGFHVIPNLFDHFLEPVFADANRIMGKHAHGEVHPIEYYLMIFSTLVAVIAIFLANKFYNKDENWTTPRNLVASMKSSYTVLTNKWYLDNFYYSAFVTPIYRVSRNFLWKVFDVGVIDGTVNFSGKFTEVVGELLRRLQSGIAQNYALLMMFGIIVIIAYLVIGF